MPNHVSIIGSAFSGNKGASAMLESSIQAILRDHPDSTFTLFSMYPSEDRLLNPYSQLQVIDSRPKQLGVTINVLSLMYKLIPPLRAYLRVKSKAIGAISRSSVLLDQMGISFTDGREKYLLYNTAAILPALLLRIPVVKCSQAIGPFKNPINRAVSKIFLPRIKKIITRGRISHSFAQEIGLRNILVSSDSAFNLELSGQERESISKMLDLSIFESQKIVIGVSPSAVVQGKFESRTGHDYRKLMADYINQLISTGYRVALIPHSVRTGTQSTQNNDLPLCVSIHNLIQDKNEVLFADHELSSQDLRYLISLCDFFVTSRFHAMVSSLAVAVPCLVIGWSHKYEEVLERFGVEDWAIGFEKLNPELLINKTIDLINEGTRIRKELLDKLPGVIKLSKQQEVIVSSILSSKSGED